MSLIVHNDSELADALPQPYRFLNKVLLRCIEDSIDLAEGGGSSDTNQSFVLHNLRLTKVGKLPVKEVQKYFNSSKITPSEITAYSFFADTDFLLIGTSQGGIIVYDIDAEAAVYTLQTQTLTKFSQQRPIVRLISCRADEDNFAIAFATDEMSYILYLSSTFVLRSQIEIDLSSFILDCTEFSVCNQSYLIVTDGTGRTLVYNCQDLHPQEGTSKNPSSKPINLEPLFDLEKCPISNGPITSESQFSQKSEDALSKKKVVKKKSSSLSKGKTKQKTVEGINLEDIPKHQAYVLVVKDTILTRFGQFPVLLMYSADGNSNLLCDFPIPCPITAWTVLDDSRVVLGFENGSFCFLNVDRRTLKGLTFPKNGSIVSIHANDGIMTTYSSTKTISAYKIDTMELLFTCSDDDIQRICLSDGYLTTFNEKSSDINVFNALSSTIEWEGREIIQFPNISFLNPSTGKYLGTASTPVNLLVERVLCGKRVAVIVCNDPVEFRASSATRIQSPKDQKRVPSPKAGGKSSVASKKGKVSRISKKGEESKDTEPEQTVVLKREILGVVKLEEIARALQEKMDADENRTRERRKLLKTLSARSGDGKQ